MYLKAQEVNPTDYQPVIFLAQAYAWLDLLDRAVERGWGDRAWLETDSDLDPPRDEPRFKILLDRIH